MELDTHKIYVSKDVIFRVDIFRFATPTKYKPMFQSRPPNYLDEATLMEGLQNEPEGQNTEDTSSTLQPRRTTQAHNIPSYLQDYVCCSLHDQGKNFCFSTITNLGIPKREALEVQVMLKSK